MFTELRSQLVTDLQVIDGVDVFDSAVTPSMKLPLIVIETPPVQYIVAGQLVGEFEMSLDVTVIVGRGVNELADLHSIIEQVLRNTVDWAFRGVESPAPLNINGAEYPGTIIHLAKSARLY